MIPFEYIQGGSIESAVENVHRSARAEFYAGGTTLIDLMKLDVMTPTTLVDIKRLPLASIEVDESGVHVGANVTNSQLAFHPEIARRYPVLSQALLSGASPQLRNMATTAGNLLQRTRCPYFRDTHYRCNKRAPGSGCDAIDGENSAHAILGTSAKCIATHPSDMCVALAMLDAAVRTQAPDGAVRRIPFLDFHFLPGDTPERESALRHGELITHVDLPQLPFAARSRYVKVRDRASYQFALASAAVALDIQQGEIRQARVALGGVATRPWRSHEAEAAMIGRAPVRDTWETAAEAALNGAVAHKHNGYKIGLAKRTLVVALRETAANAR